MKKILITAFEPFDGHASNSSYEVVKKISTQFDDVMIIKETLPVVYQPEIYQELLIKHQPDVVLLCGQAAGRKFVGIEQVAINLKYATAPDNDGVVKKGETIFAGSDVAYFGSIPTIDIVDQLKEFPLKLSLSAGGYVCNMAFYSTIYYSIKHQMDAKVGFIHFPLYDGQINEQDLPTLPLKKMVDVLNHIIKTLI